MSTPRSACGLIGLVLSGAAQAQALEFDAHGTPPIGTLGDAGAPLRVWSPLALDRGSYSFGVIGEVDGGLLFQGSLEDPNQRVALLGAAEGLNLSGGYAVSRRLAITATMPVWLASQSAFDEIAGGPTTGDLHVWAPAGLVTPEQPGDVGVSVVPWIDLPTGSPKRLLGDHGVGGGAFGALGLGAGPILLSTNLGVEYRPWGEIPGALGKLTARATAAATLPVGDSLGISGEVVMFRDLRVEGVSGASSIVPPRSTTELGAAVRGRTGGGLTWVGGLGAGVGSGVGSAQVRAWGGVGWSSRPEVEVEVVAAPQMPTPATFVVKDSENAPIVAAEVRVGGAFVGVTDAAGQLTLAQVAWAQGVTVRAPGFADATVSAPIDGTSSIPVSLAWVPTPVEIVVRDQNGAIVQGTVSVTSGPMRPAPAPIGSDGKARLALTPGSYAIEVVSPGLGRQLRAIDVQTNSAPITAEAYLAPVNGDARIGISVTDDLGRPINAKVVVDGRPVGNTGDTGLLEIADLAAEGHRVELSAVGFQVIEVHDVNVSLDGPATVKVPLQRLPGSVRVVARGPTGDPVDAVVRFDGPYTREGTATPETVRLPPQPLGTTGDRIFILRPGIWNAIVASQLYGVQLREVVVPDVDARLIVVDVQLMPTEDGDGRLAVRVVDPDGHPVDAARVRLDDKTMGLTSTGGTLSIDGLVPGTRKLTVTSPRFRDTEALPVLVSEGGAERVVTMSWKPGTVRVSARGPAGRVTDATARFVGSTAVPTLPLGADGEEFTQLEAGTWSVFIASGSFGLQQRSIAIPEDSRSLVPVDVVFSDPEGGSSELTVRVLDPDKNPIAGAAIKLDGKGLGATSTGGAMTLAELDPGPRKIEVTAEPFVAKAQSLILKEGALSVDLQLDWAPGATRVVVTGAAGPVADAVVRLAGPTTVPPRPVDPLGQRLFRLEPGSWSAVVVSPTLGMVTQEFEIVAGKKGLTSVGIAMDTLAAGESELMIRVQDPDGRPIPGASVTIGGDDKGKTGPGGALLIGSLTAGKATLAVTAEGFVQQKNDTATLGEGAQERVITLDFEPRTVEVVVADKKGAPLDAEIRFDGPAVVTPKTVGTDGREYFALQPGTWQILAVTPELGIVRKELKLGKKASGSQVVEFVLDVKRVDVTAGEVVIREQVPFDFNSAAVRPEAGPILDEVAANILANPRIIKVQVQGHSDDIGGVEANFQLSRERAAAVREALIARGVAPERLVAEGFGATRPLAPNTDEASRAKNRNVQFEILD